MTDRSFDRENEDLTRALTTFAGVALAGASGGGPLAMLAPVVTPAVAWMSGTLVRAAGQTAEDRLNSWLTELANALDLGTRETAQAFIQSSLERDANLSHLLLEEFRKLMNLLDERVIPFLAKLSASYIHEKRRPDAFARAYGEFLCEAEFADVQCLEELVSQVTPHVQSDVGSIKIERYGSAEPDADSLKIVVSHSREQSIEATALQGFHKAHLSRVFYLLKRTGIGTDNASGVYGQTSGPGVVLIRAHTMLLLQNAMP